MSAAEKVVHRLYVHGAENRYLQRRGVTTESFDAISPIGHAEPARCPTVVCTGAKGV